MNRDNGPAQAGREGRIFLIRHGQTVWNKQRYLGQADLPLDAVGVIQSREIVSYLDNEKIDRIYSSPLTRALDTIKPCAEARGLTIMRSDDLKEMHYGQWQGSLKSERRLKVSENHRYLPLPGGESLWDVYKRAERFVEGLLKTDLERGLHLVIVGHYQINRMIAGVIHRLSFKAVLDGLTYRPCNGSILDMRSVVDSAGKIQVLSSRLIETRLRGVKGG